MGTAAKNEFRIGSRIGSGAFGEIYECQPVNRSEVLALKRESPNCSHPQLQRESLILAKLQKGLGFPKTHFFGQYKESLILVMDLLGPSIEALFENRERDFTLKTVLMITDQMIQRLEYVHSQGIIHRDIKPDNMLCGPEGHSDVLSLIDFGLSIPFENANGQHREYVSRPENLNITGTVRYVSLNVHYGKEQSRRDDMISLGYVMVYLLRGHMPWSGLSAPNKLEHFTMIMKTKEKVPLTELCYQMPEEYPEYLEYCYNLKYEEKPDYAFLRKLFHKAYQRKNFSHDGLFDWTVKQTSERASMKLEKMRNYFELRGTGSKPIIPLGFHSATGLTSEPSSNRLTFKNPLRREEPKSQNKCSSASKGQTKVSTALGSCMRVSQESRGK